MVFAVMVYKYTKHSEIRYNLSWGDWEETEKRNDINPNLAHPLRNNTGSAHSQELSYLWRSDEKSLDPAFCLEQNMSLFNQQSPRTGACILEKSAWQHCSP